MPDTHIKLLVDTTKLKPWTEGWFWEIEFCTWNGTRNQDASEDKYQSNKEPNQRNRQRSHKTYSAIACSRIFAGHGSLVFTISFKIR